MKRLILIFLEIPITETFTPLESPSIPACRQTGMLEMVDQFLIPACRQGGRGQSPAFLNGVYIPASLAAYKKGRGVPFL